jgi:hypothetical protein
MCFLTKILKFTVLEKRQVEQNIKSSTNKKAVHDPTPHGSRRFIRVKTVNGD